METRKNNWKWAAALALVLAACSGPAVVDTMVDLPAHGWEAKEAVSIPFEIADNTTPFYLYYSGRYSAEYPYYNLYLMWYLKDSTGKLLSSSNMENPPAMNLFDPKTGVPSGRGMGSKKDFLVLDTNSKPVFPYKGKYSLELKQYMRTDTLVGIEAIGVKLEPKSIDP